MPYQLDNFDLRNILDNYSQPCVLINTKSAKIETANFHLVQLTGYSLDEIKNVDLEGLFPGFDFKSVVDGGRKQSSMVIKTDNPIQVGLDFKYIGESGELLIISVIEFEQDESINNTQEQIDNRILEIISEVPELSKDQLVKKILEVFISSKFADETAIYLKSDHDESVLSQVLNDKSPFFPQAIPSLELDRFNELDFWQPGRRVLSEIHRSSRDKRLQCVYTIPLNSNNKTQGLLIFGYRANMMNEKRENVIQHFAQMVSSLIAISGRYYDLLDETRKNANLLGKFSTSFEHTGNGILVLDENYQIVDFNSAFSELLKYSPVEIQNQPISKILASGEVEAIVHIINNTNQENRSINLTDRKGQRHWVNITAVTLSEKGPIRSMLFFDDQSEIERLSKSLALLEKQAALGETLAEFAHDVRNIINRQSTGVQLLAKKLNIPVNENKEISSILEDCDNFSDMMESVLSFSHQDVNSFKLIGLTPFIQKILYRNKYKAEKAGIEIQFNNRYPDAIISGDERSLERALLNLLNNAIEAVKSTGGMVSITQLIEESSSKEVTIKIADTGPGIPESLSGVLMSSQYTDKTTGTGLGLMISKKIIQAHQGRIKLDSFAGGTIFSIYLPLLEQGDVN